MGDDPSLAAFDATNSVRVRKVIEATREDIFAAFTEPDLLVQWWGPQGNITEWAEIDLRPGGAFRIHMSGGDGGYESAIAGTYIEITPPSRLVFEITEHCNGAPEVFDATKLDPTTVTIELTDLGDGRTALILTQTGFNNPIAAEAHQHGWSSAMDKLPLAAA